MGAHFRSRSLAVVLAVLALVAGQPETGHAHPLLAGRWVAPAPPGGAMVFTFSPGHHLGNGIWQGTYSYSVGDQSIIYGVYEFQMVTDHEGTLGGLTNKSCMGFNIGVVDLKKQEALISNTTYRR
jgi:hypothetical protein